MQPITAILYKFVYTNGKYYEDYENNLSMIQIDETFFSAEHCFELRLGTKLASLFKQNLQRSDGEELKRFLKSRVGLGYQKSYPCRTLLFYICYCGDVDLEVD